MFEANENQTSFGLENPIFEQPPVHQLKPVAEVQSAQPQPSGPVSHKKKLILIGSGVTLVLVLLVVALLLVSRQPDGTLPDNFFFSPVEVDTTPTALEQRVEALKQELMEADPTKRDYPFPPVDMNIRLDPKIDD